MPTRMQALGPTEGFAEVRLAIADTVTLNLVHRAGIHGSKLLLTTVERKPWRPWQILTGRLDVDRFKVGAARSGLLASALTSDSGTDWLRPRCERSVDHQQSYCWVVLLALASTPLGFDVGSAAAWWAVAPDSSSAHCVAHVCVCRRSVRIALPVDTHPSAPFRPADSAGGS